jgi:hypothetical protein
MLILKEAEAKGVAASEFEIDAEVKKIQDSQGGSEKLMQAMEAQNVTMKDLRKQIMYKQLIDKTFGGNSDVTEQEINEYKEKNKDQMPPTDGLSASESAQMKDQIKETIKAEKVNKAFDDWLRDSLQGSRVKRLQFNELQLTEVDNLN